VLLWLHVSAQLRAGHVQLGTPSTHVSEGPGLSVSDSLNVIFPGISMSNRWTFLQAPGLVSFSAGISLGKVYACDLHWV
jgi:hypothetical protein